MAREAARACQCQTGQLNKKVNARVLAECLEQLVVDAAAHRKAAVDAVATNGAPSAFADDAIDRTV